MEPLDCVWIVGISGSLFVGGAIRGPMTYYYSGSLATPVVDAPV